MPNTIVNGESPEARSLISQFAQSGLQGRLKLLQIAAGRTIAGLLGHQSEPARLIEIPFSQVPIAKGDFAADNGAGSRQVIDRD